MVQGLLGLSAALEGKPPSFVLGDVVTSKDYGWGVVVAVQPELLTYGVFLHGFDKGHTIGGLIPTNSGKWLSEREIKKYEPIRSDGTRPFTDSTLAAISERLAIDGGQGAASGKAKGRQKHTKPTTRSLPSKQAPILRA